MLTWGEAVLFNNCPARRGGYCSFGENIFYERRIQAVKRRTRVIGELSLSSVDAGTSSASHPSKQTCLSVQVTLLGTYTQD